MGLQQDAIDRVKVDILFLASDGLEKAGNTEVFSSAEITVSASDDEAESVVVEDIVGERNGVKLREDQFKHIIGIKLGEDDGISYPGKNVVVDAERKLVQIRRRSDKDDVVVFGEFLEHKTEPA